MTSQTVKWTIDKMSSDKRIVKKMTMIYWKDGQFCLGKLLEHPEIMTQGYSLEELEENLSDAYFLMVNI
jgi:hypothetical protein